jgi:uncharacterized membrane protein
MDALFPGLSRMLNLHPLFVHFPIALWAGALVFELLAVVRANDEWHRTAVRLLYLGTVLGVVALVTGLYAEESVPEGPAHEVMEIHELLMKITTGVAMGLCLVAFVAREKLVAGRRTLFLVGLVVLNTLLALGSDRGAQLVYQYGVAVNWPEAQKQQ